MIDIFHATTQRRNALVIRAFIICGVVRLCAMLIVATSAIIGYFKHPDLVFFQFLLGIAVLVLAGIFRGVRSIFLMKGGQVLTFDWGYTVLLSLNAVFMLSMHPLDWMQLHLGTMLGAFTASTTAFTVNSAYFLPWWAQWFGPTLLL
ncbi:MAG: hypothetical protein Q7T20_13260, partial [Saprospiraceae bacterium]|nr:hypothetical protein [Saprospiraceae bacterium]